MRASMYGNLRCLAIALLGCAAFLPAASQAEIYGWVDPNGDFTYSNLPPPPNARVTDVIHEDPAPPPRAAPNPSHEAEVNALNDRIRLLELEMSRSQRQVIDYPAPPPAPPGVGCGPDGAYDCTAQWGPYYSTALLYPVPLRDRHGYRGPYQPRSPASAPMRLSHASVGHSGSGGRAAR